MRGGADTTLAVSPGTSLAWKGTYDPTVAYNINDMVLQNGTNYIMSLPYQANNMLTPSLITTIPAPAPLATVSQAAAPIAKATQAAAPIASQTPIAPQAVATPLSMTLTSGANITLTPADLNQLGIAIHNFVASLGGGANVINTFTTAMNNVGGATQIQAAILGLMRDLPSSALVPLINKLQPALTI